jgi:hypothetical protein
VPRTTRKASPPRLQAGRELPLWEPSAAGRVPSVESFLLTRIGRRGLPFRRGLHRGDPWCPTQAERLAIGAVDRRTAHGVHTGRERARMQWTWSCGRQPQDGYHGR